MSVRFWGAKRSNRLDSFRRKRRQLVIAAILGAIALPLSGCSAFTGLHNTWTYHAGWSEKMLGDKHRLAARKAWKSRSHCFENQKYIKDFARGFRAGYMEVADGGHGCTPTFPPREYWGWKYQSCEGQAKVSAWFSGFPHGARAAEEDGIGNYSQIQTSLGVQQQYAQHGLLDSSYTGMYPIPEKAIPTGLNAIGAQQQAAAGSGAGTQHPISAPYEMVMEEEDFVAPIMSSPGY